MTATEANCTGHRCERHGVLLENRGPCSRGPMPYSPPKPAVRPTKL